MILEPNLEGQVDHQKKRKEYSLRRGNNITMAKKIENMAYLRSKYSNADTINVKTVDLDLQTYIVYKFCR